MSFTRRHLSIALSTGLAAASLLLFEHGSLARKTPDLQPPPPPADPALIVPGAELGRVSLNEASKFLSWIGQPRNSHASAGHYWDYYPVAPGSFQIVGIYTVRNPAGTMTFVHQAWTNCPTFHTASGDSVGTPLKKILADYPNAKPMSLAGQNLPAGTVLYDDTQSGISFQIIHVPSRKCSAILVHTPGVPALSEPLHLPETGRWDLSIP